MNLQTAIVEDSKPDAERLKQLLKKALPLQQLSKTLSTMTKAELVKAIAAQTGVEAVTVATVVEQMMEEIRQSMIGGENVYLRGFGSFILKHRAQKVARNIAKNTSITIPAHNIPAFKPSKEFMDKVK